MFYLLLLIIGFVVGITVMKIILVLTSSGTLVVDCSDPDGPYLFIELNKELSEIEGKNSITVDVEFTNYISQK